MDIPDTMYRRIKTRTTPSWFGSVKVDQEKSKTKLLKPQIVTSNSCEELDIIDLVPQGERFDAMKKWYDEEYEFEIEVTGFLRGNHTERYCRNGEEIGDRYTCTYDCPVNAQGYGICSKTMMMLYPLMEAIRSGGDLENLGGSGKYRKDIVCPDGCVMFRLTAKNIGNPNFHKGRFYDIG